MRDLWPCVPDTREADSLREQIRQIAIDELRPYAARADQTGAVPAECLEHGDVRALSRLLVPVEYGGGWRSPKGICLDVYRRPDLRVVAMEEAAYGDAALVLALPGPALAAPILAGGDPLCARVFDSFVTDAPTWAAFALSEPGAGSDATRIMATATRSGDEYVLEGTKWFVGNGARARWTVVFARVTGTAGPFAIRPFLVERGTPGFSVGGMLPSLGLRALGLASLELRSCRVPAEHALLADCVRSHGDYPWNLTFRYFRPVVAALAVGLARAALEQAATRIRQNGAVHASARCWSVVRARFGAIATRVHAARLMTRRAASEAEANRAGMASASMAKNLAAAAALEAASFAAEIAGVAGACRDHPEDRLFRDAKAFDLLEGSGDIHRLLIARSLAGQDRTRAGAGRRYGNTAGRRP